MATIAIIAPLHIAGEYIDHTIKRLAKEKDKKPLTLFIGESGSGKSTLVKEVNSENKYRELQSYTTRPPRHIDEEGHIFITNDEFNMLDDIVAYTEFCGYKYGATKKQIDKADIYVVDVAGLNCVIKECQDREIIVVYVTALEETRYKRMEIRDGKEKAQERILHDIRAFDQLEKQLKELEDKYTIIKVVNEEEI